MSPIAECEGKCSGCGGFFEFSVEVPDRVEIRYVYDALFHPEREKGSRKPFISNGQGILNRCPGASNIQNKHCYFLGEIEVLKITS